MITVLGTSKDSIYKKLGVDCYDENRNLLSYQGTNPVITHAPCRLWSSKMSHFSKAPESERELAIFCADRVITNGGIFEHPAHSRIFGKFLPRPGKGDKDLQTITVFQSWFGYPMKKETWLTFSKIDLNQVYIPYVLTYQNGHKKIFDNMSKKHRSETTEEFAKWLIKNAKLAIPCQKERSDL